VKEQFDLKKVNMCHIFLFIMVSIQTGLIQGFTQGYTTQAYGLLIAQYNWDTTGKQSLWESLIGSILYLGLALGAISAGKFVQYGRRRLAMISLVIGFAGTGVVEL